MTTPTATSSQLLQWQLDEQRIRDVIEPQKIDAGKIPHEAAACMTGLELFHALLAGKLPRPPMSNTLDFMLIHAAYGHVIFQGKPSRAHYNPMGTVHGGWYCTLLDSAVGCAVHTTLPAGRAYTTLEIKVNMIRALTDKVPLVRAEGTVIHAGRQSATAEGKLYDAEGKLYAHATTTCLVFDMPVKAQ
jgi:uncharacterized protein (TIGR00369 family)